MNINYNGYNLEVTAEDSLLVGNCDELGYKITTPNGYDRLVSRFQDTVNDYQKLQPYIEELDELSESNYPESQIQEKLNQIHEQYDEVLDFSLDDIRRHYSSRLI